MNYRLRCAAKGAFCVVAIVVLGLLVMSLWNWVMPELFADSKTIDFPHALGLMVLCRILFGGFRGKGGRGRCREERHWRKWEAMTPEEREQFQQKFTHRRWGRKEE